MSHPNHGYSLVELVIVLAIVGILVYAGATTLGNQRGAAVRSLLNELEGSLLDAQRYAINSGRDVALVSWGNPDVRSTLGLARGDAALSVADIKDIRDQMVATPPVAPTTDLGRTVAPLFAFSNGREHQNSGVVVNGSSWWTVATGSNQDPTKIEPFKSDKAFQAAYLDSASLFKGGPDPSQVIISGANGRFTSSFSIRVVGTTRAGEVLKGAAQGLLVVLNNGATVYRFYNPGSAQGDGQWRRI